MAELQIYDSQGQPIRDGAGGENQQVKDFFFDGVRLAVDSNRNEMFCFFRARDNDTARSEQYYAKYTFQSRSEMSGIYQAVKTRIEGEYGMILDTENEDTRFFELLGSSESGNVPQSTDLDDVRTLLSDYKSARVGVESYSEAYGLFSKLFSNDGVSKIAVSDNATGRSLSAYDLVIEKGDYFGLELLGDTEEKVETLREQRRSAFESEYGTEDDNDPISGLMGAALFAGIGVALVLAVIYGSCLGINMALIGDPPGVDSCGPSGPSLGNVSADTANGSQAVRITGVINGMSNTTATVNVTVVNETGAVRFGDSGDRQLDGSGNFDFSVSDNATSLSPGDYTAVVEYRDMQKNASFTVESGSGTTANTTNNTTASDGESTAAASISNVSVSGPVNSSASSIQINGTATGLANETVSVRVNITSANSSQVGSTGSLDVPVDSNGTFNLTAPFNATGTQGPYNITVYYNETATNTTFEVSDSTPPQLESVTVAGVADSKTRISFSGETSGFDGNTTVQLDYRVQQTNNVVAGEQETVTGSTEEIIEDDGDFNGLVVTDSALQDGQYKLVVVYGEMEVEDSFSVPYSN